MCSSKSLETMYLKLIIYNLIQNILFNIFKNLKTLFYKKINFSKIIKRIFKKKQEKLCALISLETIYLKIVPFNIFENFQVYKK